MRIDAVTKLVQFPANSQPIFMKIISTEIIISYSDFNIAK